MFNASRPDVLPDLLNDERYNTQEVVKVLEKMFFGKCYLCEQDELSDPEIEHFVAHEGDKTKKYDWNNLYYSCSRCNSIKSNRHNNLIDCCDVSVDVFRRFRCLMPQTPDGPVTIEPMEESNCVFTQNTVTLLDRCYNENNTPLRGITRSVLIEKLFSHYSAYLNHRCTIQDKRSTATELAHARERIQAMLKIEFPFSVFWRWHFLKDEILLEKLDDLVRF